MFYELISSKWIIIELCYRLTALINTHTLRYYTVQKYNLNLLSVSVFWASEHHSSNFGLAHHKLLYAVIWQKRYSLIKDTYHAAVFTILLHVYTLLGVCTVEKCYFQWQWCDIMCKIVRLNLNYKITVLKGGYCLYHWVKRGEEDRKPICLALWLS